MTNNQCQNAVRKYHCTSDGINNRLPEAFKVGEASEMHYSKCHPT
ncbi:MAG: hypothetical protein JWM26_2454, partial [Betaproteobacteria bacterium]|nr:hypothetical protein [Betaproteobacteria bacterium]